MAVMRTYCNLKLKIMLICTIISTRYDHRIDKPKGIYYATVKDLVGKKYVQVEINSEIQQWLSLPAPLAKFCIHPDKDQDYCDATLSAVKRTSEDMGYRHHVMALNIDMDVELRYLAIQEVYPDMPDVLTMTIMQYAT